MDKVKGFCKLWHGGRFNPGFPNKPNDEQKKLIKQIIEEERQEMANKLMSVSAVWKKESKGGDNYLRGPFTAKEKVPEKEGEFWIDAVFVDFPEEVRGKIAHTLKNFQLTIFKNTFKKEGDKQPDFKLFISEKGKPQGGQQQKQSPDEWM